MTSRTTAGRNRIIHGLYMGVLKPIFFRNDPEEVHERMVGFGAMLGRHAWGRSLTAGLFGYEDPILRQDICGIAFENPIGLSAGFDKNARLPDILGSVGFGFAEIGSVTGEPCAGNPRPRLWRLPEAESLAVYYGLANDGAEAIAARLAGRTFDIPIGISVAMTNCSANLDLGAAVGDYEKAFRVMEPHAAYITVNISCPNAEGGQPFSRPENLERLLMALDAVPLSVATKPIFVKLSPDISAEETDKLLDVIRRHRVHGIICTNLTKKISAVGTKGGLSGKAVQDLSDELLRRVYRATGGKYILIGSGGVFTAADAYRKIRLGASLVQLITGMIYEGPQMVGEVNRGVADLLRRDGFTSVTQAVGADNPL